MPGTKDTKASPTGKLFSLGGDNSMSSTKDTEPDAIGVVFPLQGNGDIMTLLADLLSNQYAFFAEVSRDWRNACDHLPRLTQAITADTSVSQLEWSFDSGLSKFGMVSERIAEHCNTELLRFAHSNGCVLFAEACYKAAARGDLEMIEWAIDQNSGWRYVVCRAAAAGGHLHILKWAHDINCSWDPSLFGARGSFFPSGPPRERLLWFGSKNIAGGLGGSCSLPFAGRRLAIFRGRESICFRRPYQTCECAAAGGHLEVLQWARRQGCPLDNACLVAIKHGNLDTLKWMVADGCTRSTIAVATAAIFGHVHILEWMHTSHYTWVNLGICEAAVAGGHPDVLEWARSNGFD